MRKLKDATRKASRESKENQVSPFHSFIESVLSQFLLAVCGRVDVSGFQLFRRRN